MLVINVFVAFKKYFAIVSIESFIHNVNFILLSIFFALLVNFKALNKTIINL